VGRLVANFQGTSGQLWKNGKLRGRLDFSLVSLSGGGVGEFELFCDAFSLFGNAALSRSAPPSQCWPIIMRRRIWRLPATALPPSRCSHCRHGYSGAGRLFAKVAAAMLAASALEQINEANIGLGGKDLWTL
jgi:hypothetical protein